MRLTGPLPGQCPESPERPPIPGFTAQSLGEPGSAPSAVSEDCSLTGCDLMKHSFFFSPLEFLNNARDVHFHMRLNRGYS